MVDRLLGLTDVDADRLRGLTMLGYAGAPMPPDQIRQAYERLTPNLVQYYGLVEAIRRSRCLDAADHAAGLAGRPDLLTSAGRPALGSSSPSSTTPARHYRPARSARSSRAAITSCRVIGAPRDATIS